MPTQSTVEKAFVYVKDTVLITFVSVATVVTSVLGVKGWKVLNKAEKALNSVQEVTDEVKKPLKTVNDIADDVGDFFAFGKRKTTNENEKIKQNKDEKKITTSNADALSGSGKNDGIDGIKGILTKFVNIVNKEIENYGKQSHNITVNKSEYPGYFTVNDGDSSEKEVTMSPIEYALYQFNSFLNEISAPALDSEGKHIQNDGKKVTKAGHIIDLLVKMVENITGTFNNDNIKEVLNGYEKELQNYQNNDKIITDMKKYAEKHKKDYNEEYYKGLVKKCEEIEIIIKKLLNGEKDVGWFFNKINGKVNNDQKGIIKADDECDQLFVLYRGVENGTKENEVYRDKLVRRLNKILIDKKKETENMELIKQCNTADGGLFLNNIGEYDILMQVTIRKWTTEYFGKYGLSGTIASLISQVMMTISKVSNALENVSIRDIGTVLSSVIWGNS